MTRIYQLLQTAKQTNDQIHHQHLSHYMKKSELLNKEHESKLFFEILRVGNARAFFKLKSWVFPYAQTFG